jgi:cyclopropane fatty-acyl-phospholipid synthase-like methyltransferase
MNKGPIGSDFDDFLAEEDLLEETEAAAIKRVQAFQANNMKDFYTSFYAIAADSPAHRDFCRRVFGADLCQHGFADLPQLELLLDTLQLEPGRRALDLGCGSGQITEYLSDRSGAHFTGLDYIPRAIEQAQQRTAAKARRLSFTVGDINHLELPDNAFDAILSIDSIYFSEDYSATLQALKTALRPDGQMAFLYSYGREPWVPREQFPKENLQPDRTPLAQALRDNGLSFTAHDLTQADYDLAQRRKTVLAELKPQFEAEDALFIYENRLGDAKGVSQAIEDGLHARYLYHIQTGRPA